MRSQSAGEQYSSQSAEYNGSRSAFLQYTLQYFYNISVPCFSSLLSQNKGILLVWELSACNVICQYLESCSGRNAVPSFSFLGSVTGRCLYLGSLNEGCKGWECSRDNLYLGLLKQGGRYEEWCYSIYTSGTHTIFHGKNSAF